MKREQVEVYNLGDVAQKHRLIDVIAKLPAGLYEVYIKPRIKARSLNANAYYFAAVATVFREFLREVWGDVTISTELAHLEIKRGVLGVREHVNERTGEVMELPYTTHDMNKEDFTIFIDKAVEFVERNTGVAVLSSDLFWESKSSGVTFAKQESKRKTA